jgi:hypothetical protein
VHEIAALGMSWDVGMSEVWEYPVPIFVQTWLLASLRSSLSIKGLRGVVSKKKK